MPDENILVIAVDGLRAAALGAYGNTTFATPALDQLAAESLVFDWCYAEATELAAIYRALWQGATPIFKALAERGYATTLVTDDAAISSFDGAGDFHDCVQLPLADPTRADDVSDTALARVFAAACEQIETTASGPRLIWVHSRGMYGPWDAPLDFQEELLAREEGDPPPEDVLEPPDLWIENDSDPDTAFRWNCAYAAQVMALDACFAGLCRTIRETGGKWHVALAGLRGFSLGEHARVGGVDGRLYAEQLHVPLLWRFASGDGGLARSEKLVSLADLPSAILSRASGEFLIGEHDAVLASGPAGQQSIRTADWSLRCEAPAAEGPNGEDSQCELFVRPDDRWEANDVAGLCPEIVASLLARLRAAPAR